MDKKIYRLFQVVSILCFTSLSWGIDFYENKDTYRFTSDTFHQEMVDFEGINVFLDGFSSVQADSKHFMQTRDILLGEGFFLTEFLIYFNKTQKDSFISVELYDAVDDALLDTFDFYESGKINFSQFLISPFYMKIYLNGIDLTLHYFAIRRGKISLLDEENFILKHSTINLQNESLLLEFISKIYGNASITLFDDKGEIVFTDSKKVTPGKHVFSKSNKQLMDMKIDVGTYYLYFVLSTGNLKKNIAKTIYIID